MKTLALPIALVFLAAPAFAAWPKEIQDIRYTSSADKTKQPAMFYHPKASEPVPLLVGLHTWSGGYKQGSSVVYANWCIQKKWIFIAPDFRGPNKTPQGTGSELAVADIASAVAYATQNAKVDPRRIYLVGASGGGYAAVLMAGRHPDLWAGVSAWVPITDLAAWHAECKKSGRKYWKDMERSCGGAPGSSAKVDAEYKKRSALTYIANAKGVNLDINAGIHDGHKGSVPISHTLLAFNALAADKDRFTEAQIASMTASQQVAEGIKKPEADATYGNKQPLVRRTSGQTRVTIFNGGHEIISNAALAWLEKQIKPAGDKGPKGEHGPAGAGPWKRHPIDPGGPDGNGLSGADGVRMADVNGDGLMDTVTGWEESKAIRVCLHPGVAKVKQPWPVVTVGNIKSAEDAVFADLDSDGVMDVISCTEGGNKTVYFHWGPKNKAEYLKEDAWKTEAVPATKKTQSWMFAVPMDIDGKNGIDIIIASKGRASVSWLESPANPRNVADWKMHKIVDAGWIMTLRSERNDTKLAPVCVTDRKGKTRGVYRLVPTRTANGSVSWKREDFGGTKHEVMFMDVWPKTNKPLVATRNNEILDFATDPATKIPNPFGVNYGKALRIGDIDLDGKLDIVHTSNRGNQKTKPGVTWLKNVDGKWKAFDIGGPDGTKFDRIELYDVDQDGDLDVITCEENGGKKSMGLGLIWYENPTK